MSPSISVEAQRQAVAGLPAEVFGYGCVHTAAHGRVQAGVPSSFREVIRCPGLLTRIEERVASGR